MTFLSLKLRAAALLGAMMILGGCAKQSGNAPGSANGNSSADNTNANTNSAAEAPADSAADSSSIPPELLGRPWKGDFDGMAERRLVRALVVYSKTMYFLDGAQQRGISYELLKEFETEINKQLGKTTLKVNVAFIPVARDELIPALLEGRGDIAAANLTVTQERLKSIDFSDPLLTDVRELLVTGPAAQPITTIDDLAGKEVHVRKSSSYYESLRRLNESFKESGKQQIKIVPADEVFEDEDLLEMVNAGLIPAVIVDSHKAEFWAQVFDQITVHKDVAVNTGGSIAWAIRKESPKLREVVNAFIKDHKQGTLFGNTMLNRYLKNVKYVKNATNQEEMKKFRDTVAFFKQYSGKYDFDWLMVTAQGYQESRLDQSVKSPVGAVGVMQIKPSTAADPVVGIKDVETNAENNIHAGVKYLRFVVNQYFKDAKMDQRDKMLFAFASYNAGPARVAQLRRQAQAQGLDPNRWFNNVEYVAAKEIGQETVQYVSNIYKYYVAYHQALKISEKRSAARKRG